MSLQGKAIAQGSEAAAGFGYNPLHVHIIYERLVCDPHTPQLLPVRGVRDVFVRRVGRACVLCAIRCIFGPSSSKRVRVHRLT